MCFFLAQTEILLCVLLKQGSQVDLSLSQKMCYQHTGVSKVREGRLQSLVHVAV